MSEPVFSLVIPCYNEAAALPELIERSELVAKLGDGEVILADNGSSDDTPEVLQRLLPTEGGRVRAVRVEVNQGYGFGIVSGLNQARGRFIGWTHADLQTDPADVLRILPTLEASTRKVLAKGRRYGRPLGDRVFTAGMSVFETALLRTRLTDINAQPTLFSRSLIDEWGDPPNDFALDLFAMHQAKSKGYQILRFPVIFAPRRYGSSSWNIDFGAKRKFIKRTIQYSVALRRKL